MLFTEITLLIVTGVLIAVAGVYFSNMFIALLAMGLILTAYFIYKIVGVLTATYTDEDRELNNRIKRMEEMGTLENVITRREMEN